MKYYIIKFIASLLVMGSLGGGVMVGAEYGVIAGLTFFVVLTSLGAVLHKTARKIDRINKNS